MTGRWILVLATVGMAIFFGTSQAEGAIYFGATRVHGCIEMRVEVIGDSAVVSTNPVGVDDVGPRIYLTSGFSQLDDSTFLPAATGNSWLVPFEPTEIPLRVLGGLSWRACCGCRIETSQGECGIGWVGGWYECYKTGCSNVCDLYAYPSFNATQRVYGSLIGIQARVVNYNGTLYY